MMFFEGGLRSMARTELRQAAIGWLHAQAAWLGGFAVWQADTRQ